ncbi:MAG TPA: PEP-CTERM/exosortase system-associated acyltransferase [Candidatus Saccharimonadales bacterium]|nr:PEP-CTERM/exosortase system-associated acyltransferase [Candidatus Saccharimonadales bacterium]
MLIAPHLPLRPRAAHTSTAFSLPRPRILPSRPQRRAAEFTAEAYTEAFNSVVAESDSLRNQAFRLRYEVFCIENTGFENPEDHPDKLESDEYDRHAVQGLLVHRYSGFAVGSVRMVLPVADQWQCSMPIQDHCMHPSVHHRDTILSSLETSRFCIPRSMRKRICQEETYRAHCDIDGACLPLPSRPVQDMIERTRALLPYLCIGLVKLPLQVAVESSREHIFATLDPRLLQRLTQLGICSKRLGEDIEFHGKRSPVDFVPIDIFENTYKNKREVWKIVTDNGRLHDLVKQKPH